MHIHNFGHLSYCTNIHPGERWEDVFQSLKVHALPLKKNLSPTKPFGIGLRLSHLASIELLEGEHLPEFKQWLDKSGLYVYTMNGFPYGGFHRTRVKDEVHQPDWTTKDRLAYTRRLFTILSYLLPQGLAGGISTSPVSYKYWHSNSAEQQETLKQGILNMAILIRELHTIEKDQGIHLHLDIEPEPDGMLENTTEVIDFYQQNLLPIAGNYLTSSLSISQEKAEDIIRRHLMMCYDICHFAVAYESPSVTFKAWEKAQIPIGKVQISAALEADFPDEKEDRSSVIEAFRRLDEPTYLHQVVARNRDGSLSHFRDLPQALEQADTSEATTWRTHFHVPLFVHAYDRLNSTRQSIEEVLSYPHLLTDHWEVETYTWEVLPADIQLDLNASIERELRWVMDYLTKHHSSER